MLDPETRHDDLFGSTLVDALEAISNGWFELSYAEKGDFSLKVTIDAELGGKLDCRLADSSLCHAGSKIVFKPTYCVGKKVRHFYVVFSQQVKVESDGAVGVSGARQVFICEEEF